MEDLISIIVPVYNVCKYIGDCIDSLINQKYKNIEIIVVDDGSTDGSGNLCDKYKERDSRIIVIHKKNGGLSSARNAGLRIASGNYIGFVDSDDIADVDLYYVLWKEIKKENADISICNYKTFGIENSKVGNIRNLCIEQEQAMNLLVEDKIMPSYMWNKLFKKELFLDLIFDENLRYEDMRIMHKLFMRGNKIVASERVLYYYRIREGSIVNSTNNNSSIELLEALESRRLDLKNTKYFNKACITEMIHIRRVVLEMSLEYRWTNQYREKYIRKIMFLYKQCHNDMKKSQKFKFLVFVRFPDFYARYLYLGRNEK